MKRLIILFSFAVLFFSAQAQLSQTPTSITPEDLETIKKYEDTLGLLSFLIVNDSLEANRLIATKKFIPTLVNALKISHSFDYSFERLRTISIQYPADSTFRIFTWQLYVDDNDYRYFGAIQMNNEELKLFPLRDRSFEIEDAEREILSADRWYGALYYNVMHYESPEGPKYLLFGYDSYNFFTRRKLIEVLSFQEGKPVFGAPVFVSNDPNVQLPERNRLVLTYSAEAAIKLNFDEHLGLILYDHLIEGTVSAQGPTKLPDGSYEGFKLENGQWVYQEKIFNHIYEEAPREEPLFEDNKDGKKKKRKNIFGRQ